MNLGLISAAEYRMSFLSPIEIFKICFFCSEDSLKNTFSLLAKASIFCLALLLHFAERLFHCKYCGVKINFNKSRRGVAYGWEEETVSGRPPAMVNTLSHARTWWKPLPNKRRANSMNKLQVTTIFTGRSPGLVVVSGDSCSDGIGSNPSTIYWMNILLPVFDIKIVVFAWKDKENKRKEAEYGPFKKLQFLEDRDGYSKDGHQALWK